MVDDTMFMFLKENPKGQLTTDWIIRSAEPKEIVPKNSILYYEPLDSITLKSGEEIYAFGYSELERLYVSSYQKEKFLSSIRKVD